ncbi:MerR family DNA-binding transcriptional regulator [Paenibacillus sp. FSL H8-0048]|uniref:MerR family DNA-binding transcriptional regulator n=1 Tax=Paenibacillus sp. FSL H8-0048 TaxID=2954508 RepID=UPI0030FBA740
MIAINSIEQAAHVTSLTKDTIRYYEKIGLLGILFLTRLKATGMTIEEMKRYRELSSHGNDAIPEKMSMLEMHKQNIQNEISRLMEVQKIIEYKLDHYHEIIQDPDFNDTGCTPTL